MTLGYINFARLPTNSNCLQIANHRYISLQAIWVLLSRPELLEIHVGGPFAGLPKRILI